MLQFAITLVFQEMIALTCHIKTRFLEITDRKDRGKYNLEMPVDQLKLLSQLCERHIQLSEFGRHATSMLSGDEHYT